MRLSLLPPAPPTSCEPGRTFPSHPYFSDAWKGGQADLYVVLKGYAVADREIGYCQGLSFVAGMFLMHVSLQAEIN